MTKPQKTSSKLTVLGDEAEALLTVVLKDMKKDMKLDTQARKYSLTDQMKVLDRIAKFESIRAKIVDDEGQFFTEEPTEDEGENDDGT